MRLSELLNGPASTAVYRAPAGASLATIERAAANAGWAMSVVHASGPVDKGSVLAAFQDALGFPGWFGHNLDALADSLGDVDARPGTLVVWRDASKLSETDPATYRAVLAILRERTGAVSPARFLALLLDG